jgi:hypothetical protein
VGVEERLLKDIAAFAKDVELLNEKEAFVRTLGVLGISGSNSSMTRTTTLGGGRSQRPAPAGASDKTPPELVAVPEEEKPHTR